MCDHLSAIVFTNDLKRTNFSECLHSVRQFRGRTNYRTTLYLHQAGFSTHPPHGGATALARSFHSYPVPYVVLGRHCLCATFPRFGFASFVLRTKTSNRTSGGR